MINRMFGRMDSQPEHDPVRSFRKKKRPGFPPKNEMRKGTLRYFVDRAGKVIDRKSIWDFLPDHFGVPNTRWVMKHNGPKGVWSKTIWASRIEWILKELVESNRIIRVGRGLYKLSFK